MKKLMIITRSLFLNKKMIAELTASSQWNKWAMVMTIFLGIYYGITNIVINASLISSFETGILRNVLIPSMFILGGVMMIIITRLGFTLLLWAGAKGMGGPGLLGIIYRITGFAMFPFVLSIPILASMSQGNHINEISILIIILSFGWIYFYLVNAMKITQKFAQWKAYMAVLLVYLFFTSIYYIFLPTA